MFSITIFFHSIFNLLEFHQFFKTLVLGEEGCLQLGLDEHQSILHNLQVPRHITEVILKRSHNMINLQLTSEGQIQLVKMLGVPSLELSLFWCQLANSLYQESGLPYAVLQEKESQVKGRVLLEALQHLAFLSEDVKGHVAVSACYHVRPNAYGCQAAEHESLG